MASTPTASGGTLHDLLFQVAACKPDQACLKEVTGKSTSYAEVAAAVQRCATHLAVLEDAEVVALVAWRSRGMVVSLLGVLRAGKAYCPIEPDFPASRVASMFETAAIAHALVPVEQHPQAVIAGFADLAVFKVNADGYVETALGVPAPSLPGAVPKSVSDTAAAYVLFTSGSTGRPKGCVVGHRGSSNYCQAVVHACDLKASMTFILKTAYVFDVSVQDIFTAFAAGGALVLAPPRSERDAGAICDIIAEQGVNCACFVPTLLVEFVKYLSTHPVDAGRVATVLRRVLTIGEALMSATCRQLFQLTPDVEVHNLYGPTEASVGVSHHKVTATSLGDEVVVPIGKTFDYVVFKVFDPSQYENAEIQAELLKEVRDGDIGELFIGGDCLAKGYINSAEKTRDAFFHFADVVPRPDFAASPFSLYKTGDLVRRRADGIYDYLGRSDFQVKIAGVRIECEEVSAVLKEHPVVDDALVAAFDGPFGKALAAYLVVRPDVTATEILAAKMEDAPLLDVQDQALDQVSRWGAVYDEMYLEEDNSVSEQDPTLNWSGYIDTYSGRSHSEPVIKEWVERSCEQVSCQKRLFEANRTAGRQTCILEIGCGNGMLLFRLAPLVGDASQGRYIGTDISSTALRYVENLRQRREYAHLRIDTAKLGAHEIDQICAKGECDIALCNGVTMYFPSAAYLLDSMRMAVSVTRPGGRVLFGDVQSKRHLLAFRAHVETYHALGRPEATAAAVLHAVYEMASREELSYFDDELFHRLDRLGADGPLGGAVARVELRLKRGWWGSEFSRFRYDVELVLDDTEDAGLHSGSTKSAELKLTRVSYSELCHLLRVSETPSDGSLVDPRFVTLLPGWAYGHISGVPEEVDGIVVTLPNARTLQAARLLEWLQLAAREGKALKELPSTLHPRDVGAGSPEESANLGIEPEMLFSMSLPQGWTQRVIWSSDPGMLRFVLLREAAAEQRWVSVVCEASDVPLPADLSSFKNQPEDIVQADLDPIKVWDEHFKGWAVRSRLLPAMRPAVYIVLDTFPKNAAGKTDRSKLPDANTIMEQVSDVASFSYEPPSTEEECKMVAIWEKVFHGRQVGVNTPFVAYGGHSLTAVQLCSSIFAEFGFRPDLLFLTSADCTIRELLKKFKQGVSGAAGGEELSCVTRLSPPASTGLPLLIFCAAGSSAASYQAVAELMGFLQVYAVELQGRGRRAHEPPVPRFGPLFQSLVPDVTAWAEKQHRFFVWGDSLGAILAYEFLCRFEESNVHVMGLFVSGNAGPTVASTEQGTGSTMQMPGGEVSSSDMNDEQWKTFLLAGASAGSSDDLAKILADPDLAQAVIRPLRADCLAYESYRMGKVIRLWTPILTLCGTNDRIVTPKLLRTWSHVAKGRIEHTVIPRAGHRIAQECPRAVAEVLRIHSLPSFADELGAFRSYIAAYRLLRRRDQAGAASKLKQGTLCRQPLVSSPTLGASNVPPDFCLTDLSLNLQAVGLSPTTLTPQSKQVIVMRHGNVNWRSGEACGIHGNAFKIVT
mmetsp:Transcript_118028/g.378332  ORF Transcript_118028/g.378332 Transcript_118028/m.378332 type:complete len:1518 (+) Transcript_118028:176-4729(+)